MGKDHLDIHPHHTADVCQDEGALAETVADFLATGYYLAEPLVLITTPARRDAIRARLSMTGISWDGLQRSGEAVFCDGPELLGRFMVDGMPQESAFRKVVHGILQGRSSGRSIRIRCFGDMVDVLCHRGKAAAALRLEELWNGLARDHRFTLLCGYIRGNLYRELNGRLSDRICRQHADVRTVASQRNGSSGPPLSALSLQRKPGDGRLPSAPWALPPP